MAHFGSCNFCPCIRVTGNCPLIQFIFFFVLSHIFFFRAVAVGELGSAFQPSSRPINCCFRHASHGFLFFLHLSRRRCTCRNSSRAIVWRARSGRPSGGVGESRATLRRDQFVRSNCLYTVYAHFVFRLETRPLRP